jgi:hypothetical protein
MDEQELEVWRSRIRSQQVQFRAAVGPVSDTPVIVTTISTISDDRIRDAQHPGRAPLPARAAVGPVRDGPSPVVGMATSVISDDRIRRDYDRISDERRAGRPPLPARAGPANRRIEGGRAGCGPESRIDYSLINYIHLLTMRAGCGPESASGWCPASGANHIRSSNTLVSDPYRESTIHSLTIFTH